MSKRILIFSHDPGGANTVIPLADPLVRRGYETLWYGKGPALKKYREYQILDVTDLSQTLPESTPKGIADFLHRIKPDAVVTATSAVEPTEKELWFACEKQRIPALAILDQWLNYGIRFSPYTVHQLAEYQEDKRFPYLPAQIGLMDEFARREAIAEGLPEDRLVITGQPYFETVRKKAAEITEQNCIAYRESLGIKQGELTAVFASEPLYQEQGEPGYLGYTERSSLRMLVEEGIQKLCDVLDKSAVVIVRRHPREEPNNFDGVLPPRDNTRIRIVFENQSSPHLAMLSADLVCGMSSMFLIEGALLGKAVLSVTPGLKGESPFVLDRMGMNKSVTNPEELSRQLPQLLRSERKDAVFCPIENASENIANLLDTMLCKKASGRMN